MKKLLIWIQIAWLVALSGGLVTPVSAHGGAIIINSTQGRYQITASLGPAPLSVGRGDLQIAVRDATTFEPIPVEAVLVRIAPLDGSAATEHQATSDLAPQYAIYNVHDLSFTSVGDWRIAIEVVDADQTLHAETTVAVAGGAWRWLNVAIYFGPLLVLAVLIGLVLLRSRRTAAQVAAS